MSDRFKDFVERVLWGVKRGIAYAAIFSALALILSFLEGESQQALGMGITKIIAMYFAGGLLGGGVVGVLRPYTEHLVGSIVVGVLVVFSVMMVILLTMMGWFSEWSAWEWVFLMGYSIVIGGYAGRYFWRETQKERRAERMS